MLLGLFSWLKILIVLTIISWLHKGKTAIEFICNGPFVCATAV